MSDISIILPVRDQENAVAPLVRCGVTIADSAFDGPMRSPPVFELLALDERSGDNTLSVLSVLHGQIPSLRTLQDIESGGAIGRAARVARGNAWLILDRPIDPALGTWALRAILDGRQAVIVPGELLAVSRELGLGTLTGLRGGLISAQGAVTRALRQRSEEPIFSPPTDTTTGARAKRLLRRSLGRLGLGRFDRP